MSIKRWKSDGPPASSQGYRWEPKAFQGKAYPNPSTPYERTHGDTTERPFPLPGRVERKRKPKRRKK